MEYIYNGILLGHLKKKKENFAICSNMDGLGGPFPKGEKSDTKRQILYDITYWWNLKLQQTSEYNKKAAESQTQRTNLWLALGRRKTRGT